MRATFEERFVGRCSPTSLGAIRFLIFAILLTNALWENLPSVAYLPAEMRQPMGVVQWLYDLPIGFEQLHASHGGLLCLQIATVLLISCAMVGLLTRVTVPLAAFSYLVFGGILREYDHFFHTCVVPLQLAIILSFMPCGDGFSLDRLLRERRKSSALQAVSSSRYGWCRYCCWIVIVAAYFCAGLSKLRGGGLFWWEADNVRAIVMTDALNPMQFQFSGGLYLAGAADWVFAVIGLSGLIIELSAPLILFSRRARTVLPILFVGLHVGILILQNILFFDLILIQLLFYNWRPLARRVVRSVPDPVRRLWCVSGTSPTTAELPSPQSWASLSPRFFALSLVAIFAICWIRPVEYYPLTAWQMYCGKSDSGDIQYFRVWAHYADGTVKPARFEKWIGAMADARYRRVISEAEQGKTVALHRFLAACFVRANATEDKRIRAFEIQQWGWNTSEPNQGTNPGTLRRILRYSNSGLREIASSAER